MERITIKAYAKKHKLSIFNVVKMAKSGQIPTEIMDEEGKEVTYILLDEEIEQEVSKKIVDSDQKAGERYSLRQENLRLKKEIAKLKEEIERLKKSV